VLGDLPVVAAVVPSDEALAWARRALAGHGDVFTAAVRAVELDPEFPERNLIARTTGHVAPWPGLAEPRRTTPIAAPAPARDARIVDLGSGVIAYEAEDCDTGYVGVDVLARRVRWTSRGYAHYRDDLWCRVDDGEVFRRDPLGGAPTQVIDSPPLVYVDTEYHCLIDDERVRVEIVERPAADGADFDVIFHDIAGGTSRRVLAHRGYRAAALTIGDAVAITLDSTIRVLDVAGRERWSHREFGTAYAFADGLVFVGARPMRIVDAATGRIRGELDFFGMFPHVAVHADRLLVSTFRRAAALLRESLAVLWRRDDLPRGDVFATATALLLLRSRSNVAPAVELATELLALDPRDGTTRATLDLRDAGSDARTAALVAGKLVMLAGTGVVVID
jgi:hypothetical protein